MANENQKSEEEFEKRVSESISPLQQETKTNILNADAGLPKKSKDLSKESQPSPTSKSPEPASSSKFPDPISRPGSQDKRFVNSWGKTYAPLGSEGPFAQPLSILKGLPSRSLEEPGPSPKLSSDESESRPAIQATIDAVASGSGKYTRRLSNTSDAVKSLDILAEQHRPSVGEPPRGELEEDADAFVGENTAEASQAGFSSSHEPFFPGQSSSLSVPQVTSVHSASSVRGSISEDSVSDSGQEGGSPASSGDDPFALHLGPSSSLDEGASISRRQLLAQQRTKEEEIVKEAVATDSGRSVELKKGTQASKMQVSDFNTKLEQVQAENLSLRQERDELKNHIIAQGRQASEKEAEYVRDNERMKLELNNIRGGEDPLSHVNPDEDAISIALIRVEIAMREMVNQRALHGAQDDDTLVARQAAEDAMQAACALPSNEELLARSHFWTGLIDFYEGKSYEASGKFQTAAGYRWSSPKHERDVLERWDRAVQADEVRHNRESYWSPEFVAALAECVENSSSFGDTNQKQVKRLNKGKRALK